MKLGWMISGIGLCLLSGCVSANQLGGIETSAAGGAEQPPVLSVNETTMKRLSGYGARLSIGYAKLADRTQTTRDVTSVMLIAVAADGALGAIDGDDAADLGRRAVAGLTLSQTSGYLNPATATGGLYLASKRALCLSNVASIAPSESPIDKAFIINGFQQTQIDARASLRGTPPDFETLAQAYAKAIKAEAAAGNNFAPRSIPTVETQVAACLATSKNS